MKMNYLITADVFVHDTYVIHPVANWTTIAALAVGVVGIVGLVMFVVRWLRKEK
jgi:hypothetical protein